ncbi:MAG: ATP synthase A1 subunit C [Actinobacteria bacterium]|nr:MAG: ATP synthase A1 subunit C [Actinomycetota bacterium]
MSDYGYANTRVRAMKSTLFTASFIEQLLSAPDLNQFLTLLRKTPYQKDVEKGMVKYPGVLGVEEGLKTNMVNTFRHIMTYSENNKQGERLIQVILSRWDIHNLKTIFRGLHADVPKDEVVEQLVPAGELDEAHLHELAQQGDVKSCIDLLAMWKVPYSEPLNEGYHEYIETRHLANFELVLDRFYYLYALKKSRGRTLNHRLVQTIIKREVDLTNVMTLLRFSRETLDKEEFDPEPYFINGGLEITKEKFLEYFALNEVEDIVNALENTLYYPVLKAGLKHFYVLGTVSALERKIEEYIIQKTVALFKADPLGIAIITAYIWAKFNETVNLRIIARGKDVGMPQDQIKEALVLV